MSVKNIIIIIALAVVSHSLTAQSSVLYHMKGIPQTKELNPALFNKTEAFYIGMPLLSGIDIAASTNGWTYSDLIQQGKGNLSDSLVVNIDNFYNSLDETNFIREALNVTILEFGFRAGKNFIGLSLSERQFFNSNWDNNIIAPFTTGADATLLGENYSTGDLGVSALGYHQMTLNYGREVNEKLTIGFAAKALFAYAAIDAEALNIEMVPSNDGYTIDILGKGNANFSLPGKVVYEDNMFKEMTSSNEDYIDAMTSTDNFGLAFDFGADYQFNDRFSISASVIDLGKIAFKTNAHKLTQDENGYAFTGIDISENTDEEFAEDLIEAFRFRGEEGNFSMALPTKVYLSGAYALCKNFELGALTRMRFINSSVSSSLTASANAYIGKFLSLATSYSIMEGSYDNIGVGLGLRGGGMQFYAAADDIISAVNPSRANNATVRVGINILLNRHFKDKNKVSLEE